MLIARPQPRIRGSALTLTGGRRPRPDSKASLGQPRLGLWTLLDFLLDRSILLSAAYGLLSLSLSDGR